MDDLPEVDYVKICLEEVALEGLDGITLNALWIRLQHRPNFCMALDEPAKEYMWEICALHPEIELFELPAPREPLVVYNRFAHVDAETGLIIEPDSTVPDIYPFEAIKDTSVFGSCATYYTRKPITDDIRMDGGILLQGLTDVICRYDEKLVMVATGIARRRILFGPEADPCLQLVPLQYMMLERIGRSRYLGEVTQGNASLSSLHQCAKTMFYHRKRLIKNSLITKQLHYQRSKPGFIRNGMLLHLTRFYVERKPKIFVFLQEVCRYLQARPNRSDTIDAVREYMGVKNSIIRKTFKKFMSKLIETKRVPVLEVDPNAPAKDCYFNNGKEKLVSVLRLLDKVNPENLEKILSEEEEGPKKKSDDDDDDEADDDADEDEAEDFLGTSIIPNQNPYLKRRGKLQFSIPDQSYQLIDRPLLNQAYDVFRQCGPEGESLRRVGALLGVPRLESRALCRNLTRSGAITPFMKDSGRQRITNYVAKCYAKTSQSCLELIQDCQNLLNFSKVDNSVSEDAACTDGLGIPGLDLQVAGCQISSALPTTTDSSESQQKPATFMEGVKKISAMDKLKDGYTVTPRMVKRMILIVQAVQESRVVDSYVKLMKLITKEETKEGYFCRIDRRSVLRIIHILSKEGFIRSIKTILKHGDKEQKVHLICDPSVKNDDSLVINSLEQAKFRHFCINRDSAQTLVKDENIDTVHSSVMELRNLYGSACQADKAPVLQSVGGTKRHGMVYGYESKFKRMKTIHQFLFYLAYDYGGSADCPVPDDVVALQAEEQFSLPKVYHPDKSWRMFVAPLPQHVGWKRGWCLFSDIILRMPLCIFLRLYNVNYVVEGLSAILDDPIKRNFPLSHLPHSIRSCLLITRKYIFALHEEATRLVYIGLLSFSQRSMKDKDQIFMFVHRHARVVDTTSSAPGYHLISDDIDYPVRNYQLETVDELLLYWVDLENVCMHTPLGFYNVVQGKRFTFEVMYRKPQLMAATASKTDDEIVDDGFIPGDGRGAGGLDSAFFAHLKRNWNWVNLIGSLKKNNEAAMAAKAKGGKAASSSKSNLTSESKKAGDTSLYISYLLKTGSQIKFPINAKERLTRLAITKQLDEHYDQGEGKGKKRKKKAKKPVAVSKNLSEEKIVHKKSRVMNRKETKPRKPYYDDTDCIALTLVRRRRVQWTSKEDSMLLLCRVASTILRPDNKYLYVPFTVIRDVMHKYVAASVNKTSRACQRRMHYMMLNEQTIYNVAVFIGEANENKEIVEICKEIPDHTREEQERVNKFNEVMIKLLDEVKGPASSSQAVQFDLPDTLEALNRRYRVTRAEEYLGNKKCFTDVKNIVDIHFNVVCALIMSSLMVKDDKHWSYLLYQVYQQYPEILLTSALNRLRSTQMVCRRKNASKLLDKKSVMFTLPYQLAIKFDFMLLNRFRSHIYSEADDLMKLLQADRAGDRTGVPIVPANDSGGYAAAIVTLLAKNEVMFDLSIPDEVVIMDLKANKLSSKEMEDLMSKTQQTATETTWTLSTKSPKSEDETKSTASDCPPPAKKLCLKKSPKEALAVVDSKLQTSEIDEAINAARPEKDVVELKNTTSKVRFGTSLLGSRLALYMLRKQLADPALDNVQRAHDYLIINVCPISCHLIERPPDGDSPSTTRCYDLKSIWDQESKFIPSAAVSGEVVEANYCSLGYSQEAIEEMRSIYNYISRKRELGAVARDLNNWFYQTDVVRQLSLKKHIELMTAENLVVRVGIVSIHYVAQVHVKPWLVHSYKLGPYPPNAGLAQEESSVGKNQLDTATSDAAAVLCSLKDQCISEPSTSCGAISAYDEEIHDGSQPNKSKQATQNIFSIQATKMQTRSKLRKKFFRVKVPSDQRKEDQLHFVCPPWRTPDGGINNAALEVLLKGVLGYVMCFPGVSQLHLFNKYGAALTPVQIMSLLQMLENLRCITRMSVRHSHKPGLFAPKVQLFEDTNATANKLEDTEDSSSIFYSPEVDCFIKLGQLFRDC